MRHSGLRGDKADTNMFLCQVWTDQAGTDQQVCSGLSSQVLLHWGGRVGPGEDAVGYWVVPVRRVTRCPDHKLVVACPAQPALSPHCAPTGLEHGVEIQFGREIHEATARTNLASQSGPGMCGDVRGGLAERGRRCAGDLTRCRYLIGCSDWSDQPGGGQPIGRHGGTISNH